MKYETTMEIDLEKLKNNTKLLCETFNEYDYKLVDLRDNAHGLGLKIIDTMSDNGINYCLVGSIKDALEIRHFNKDIKILVNYYVTEEEIYDCINNDIAITIYSIDYLDKLLKLKLKDKLNVHILIDNGSNLMGVSSSKDLKQIISLIDESKYFNLEGIYSEITSLGVEDEHYYEELSNFSKLINNYKNRDLIIHLNEPIMYHLKENFINGIRFDLSIIGIEERIKDDFLSNIKIKNIDKKYGDLKIPKLDLRLVFNITTEIMTKKRVKKGTLIGKRYVAKDDLVVGVLPIGYKDGITKAIQYVVIDGVKRNILGDEIDYLTVEIDYSVKEKDKVLILNEERGIYEFLSLLKTNRYYLMSILNKGLNRVYINGDEKKGDYL